VKHLVFTFLISFFIISFFSSCQSPEKAETVSIVWKDNKAVGLIIPESLIGASDHIQLKVQLAREEHADVLGDFKMENKLILFESLVPLTRGLQYRVVANNSIIAEIEVPLSDTAAPELLAIYPTADTLPENLLKIYLKFSQPMEEGSSLRRIGLIKNDRDTMKGTFLDLQPELWNNDGTVLTLWLDPGRVKRDLIPNKELGAPLRTGEKYALYVSKSWRSKNGTALKDGLTKKFITVMRDDESPSPDKWKLKIPIAGTKDPLEIDLIEALDYSLLNDAILLKDANNNVVKGEIQLRRNERSWKFLPSELWKAGDYSLNIETRLEDVAGNNINRPFDRDLKHSTSDERVDKIFTRTFTVH
jgi:hypothetical protein